MQRDERAGGGSAATLVKQEHFTKVIEQQMALVMAAMRKPHPEWPSWKPYPHFVYIDLNGGPGIVGQREDDDRRQSDPSDEPILGSPVIALRTALDMDVPFHGYIFEQNPASCASLYDALVDELMDWRLSRFGHDSSDCDGCTGCDRFAAEAWLADYIRIIPGDHNETVPSFIARGLSRIKQPVFGLIYADPYGKIDLPLEPLRALTRVPILKRVDVLVNVAAMAYKRTRHIHPDSFLLDDLAKINKEHRWIRQPVGAWQWTMFILTNYVDYKASAKMGFFDTKSAAGQQLARELNFIKAERERDDDFPLGVRPPIHPTDPMPSIFVTRSSSPSAPSPSSVAGASASGANPLAQPSPIT